MTNAPTSPRPRRVFAVLGMHRSGTSWLAGSLQEKGLELGEVSTADPHNLKGNRESAVLMGIHDGVLRDNKGSWKRPSFPIRWSAERSAELASFIRAMDRDHPAWGFKDPRALLVLDEWLRQVPSLRRIGVFRHPSAVHRSLAARNPRFDEARSAKLWCVYNERLVEEHRRAPFPILRFDVPQADLTRTLDAASRSLELPAPDRTSGFFAKELVHQGGTAETDVPRACRALWDELCGRALRA